MPELPEVEALRLGLKSRLVGSKILGIKVKEGMGKLVSSNGTTRVSDPLKILEFENMAIGRIITDLDRRAKNIMIHLDDGSLFLVHLKMTGQLVFVSSDNVKVIGGHPMQESTQDLPHKHTYITLELDTGTLYYNDVRQFGYVLYFPSYTEFQKLNHFDKLGAEPLSQDFDYNTFAKKLKTKKSPLKKVLLDQTVVVGCGNIYADEVCFASGVLPTRMCDTLTRNETQKLYNNIKRILSHAVEQGGSSIANYLLADGSRGNYADYHNVYGKKGKPCVVCGNLLSSSVVATRTTVFCTHCQK
jgi:formamidopyrimidine-DNA glycosylase